MTFKFPKFSSEPAAWIGALTSVATVLADFGLHLTHDQWAHLLDLVPVLMGLVVRSQVSPANAPKATDAHLIIPGE